MNIKLIGKICMYSMFYIAFFLLGFIAGIIFIQHFMVIEATNFFSNSNLEININMNETRMVEETYRMFNETILPQIQKENQTWQNVK